MLLWMPNCMFLVSPAYRSEREDGTAKVYRITTATVMQCVQKWQNSVVFDFQPGLFCLCEMSQQNQTDQKAMLRDLQRELRGVSEWFELGVQVGISADELKKIRRDHNETDVCRLEMLMKWELLETPTWTKLIQGLCVIKRKALAKGIGKKYGIEVTDHEAEPRIVESGTLNDSVTQDDLMKMERDVLLNEELLEKTKQQKERLSASLKDELTSDIPMLQAKIHFLDSEVESLRKQVSLKMEENMCLEEAGKKLRKWCDAIERMKKAGDEKLKVLQKELREMEGELTRVKQQLATKEKELSRKSNELEKKSAEVRKLQMEYETLRLELTTETEKFTIEKEEMNLRIIEAEKLSLSQHNSLKDAKLRLETAKEEISNKEKEIEHQNKLLLHKEEEIDCLTLTVEEKGKKVLILKQELEAQDKKDNEKAQLLCSLMIDIYRMKEQLSKAEDEQIQAEIALKKAQTELQQHKSMIPDISKCYANLKSSKVIKHQDSQIQVCLFNEVNNPCTGYHIIYVQVTSELSVAGVVSQVTKDSTGVYTVTYRPTKIGPCDILVRVNGSPLSTVPLRIHVQNNAVINKCYADPPKTSEIFSNVRFQVHLVDEDGDPCVGEDHKIHCYLTNCGINNPIKITLSEFAGVYTCEYTPVQCGWQNIMVTIDNTPLPNAPFKVFILPSHPYNVRACPAGVSSTAISLEWSKPEHGSECVENYIVKYIEGKNTWARYGWKSIRTKGNITYANIAGLVPEESYLFKVCAECVAGSSKFSSISNPIETQSKLQIFFESHLPKLFELINSILLMKSALKQYKCALNSNRYSMLHERYISARDSFKRTSQIISDCEKQIMDIINWHLQGLGSLTICEKLEKIERQPHSYITTNTLLKQTPLSAIVRDIEQCFYQDNESSIKSRVQILAVKLKIEKEIIAEFVDILGRNLLFEGFLPLSAQRELFMFVHRSYRRR